MVFHIAKKEFHNNLLSARFLIGFLLCLVLIPFSILINIDDYRDQLGQHRIDRDVAEKAMAEVRVYSALKPIVVFPPEPLAIFGKGLSAQVGNQVKVRLGVKPILAEGKTAARDNPFLASFFTVDFVDIAAIIFSLLALLFSYDALTREKEDGTLRLQMANSLGRSKLLAGKVVGILVTLLPVVVFCFLLGGIIVLFSGDLSFGGRGVGPAGLCWPWSAWPISSSSSSSACSSPPAPATPSPASSSACFFGSCWSSSSPTCPPRSPRASSPSSPGTTSTPSSRTWTEACEERIRAAVAEAPRARLEYELVDERRRRRLPRDLWLHGLVLRAAAPRDGLDRADAPGQRRPEMGAAEGLPRQPVAPVPGRREPARSSRRPESSGPWPRPSAGRTAGPRRSGSTTSAATARRSSPGSRARTSSKSSNTSRRRRPPPSATPTSSSRPAPAGSSRPWPSTTPGRPSKPISGSVV